jgi:hypothetical protein
MCPPLGRGFPANRGLVVYFLQDFLQEVNKMWLETNIRAIRQLCPAQLANLSGGGYMKMLKVSEVTKRLRVSKGKIYRMIKNGTLPHV